MAAIVPTRVRLVWWRNPEFLGALDQSAATESPPTNSRIDRRATLHKVDNGQLGSPLMAVLFAIQINMRQNVRVGVIRVSEWIRVRDVALNVLGMNDLVAAFAECEDFLFSLWPVRPQRAAVGLS